ncbi:Uncharacterized protein LAWI1_G000593 [Lachnellula willkommii]|uniref:5'-3' DNA helicase ZGRF1-like N-terminal domain-containing protein n=1 Tax=Lachnellula willkommii TaxID=215461 RepID=A0A559MK91_9HELO|nr:Uncharacterized protein LAWI1_G000593 [Lachnellula willkommii]
MAAVYGSATSMEVPQTQNTAPVFEFRCLYTQQIRQKVKRWQDGRLKYHTFNKRVMVYDERSNFVGDTHWQEDTELDEGEELELERNGFLVQVADFIGKRDQDLTEIVDKRIKEKGERAAAKLAASPAVGRAQESGTPAPYLKPKPLNTLLTPTGHYGRAVVSSNSPFEERQHRNGSGGGNENEPPAKRRKQNESSQSKNGYVQKLMGASLTLASSKPPGTASIRYEPFKTKPSISQRPPMTIDLTSDDDGEVGVVRSKTSGARESFLENRRNPTQKTKRHKSPPAKSTYAGNLTGVSLSLSRPDPVPTKRPSIVSVLKPNPIGLRDDSDSSTEENDSFLDIDPSRNQTPVPLTKRRDAKTTKANPRPRSLSPASSPPIERSSKPNPAPRKVLVNHSRSSSPVPERPLKKSKTVPFLTRNEIINPLRSSSPMIGLISRKQNSVPSLPRTADLDDVTRQTDEQPVSALRIKARPPRKMMMLMDRPNSHSCLRDDLRHTPKTAKKQANTLNEIVLSQATHDLDAFCQKQEERLQARLNGQRPKPSLDLDDFDSSPLDTGINHQAIDDLLTRKPTAVHSVGVPESNRPASASKATSKDHSVPSAKLVGNKVQEGAEDQDIPDRRISTSNIADLPSPNAIVSEHLNSRLREEATPVSPKALPSADANTHDSDKARVSKHIEFVPESNKATTSTIDVSKPASEVTSAKAVAVNVPPVETIASKVKPMSKTTPRNKPPRPHKPPKDVNGALEPTLEHFRSLVKASSTSSAQPDESPILPEDTVTEHAEKPLNENLHQQKPELASPEVQFEQSHNSPSVEQALPSESRNSIGFGFRSANNLHATNTSEAVKTVAATNNAGMETIKVRLLNPATRGKSLQKTVAESNDVMAQSLKAVMPPPPAPRILSRPVARVVSARNDVDVVLEEGQERGSDGVSLAGPWSRESFDLFGSWKPPGRATNDGPIAG